MIISFTVRIILILYIYFSLYTLFFRLMYPVNNPIVFVIVNFKYVLYTARFSYIYTLVCLPVCIYFRSHFFFRGKPCGDRQVETRASDKENISPLVISTDVQ